MADSRIGVGMPAGLWLDEFGSKVWDAFGDPPYLVGSAIKGEKPPRDVDVRVILDDEEYERQFGAPGEAQQNGRWVALCLAFSALGEKMTGLPIDFQIQQRTAANTDDGPRSALGLVPLRYARLAAPDGRKEETHD